MNTAALIWAYIRRRPLTWAFHVLILALGVGVVTGLLLVQRGLDARFTRDIGQVDLVVGAKGSPLQLILSSVFQIDAPTGNIPLAAAERIAAHPLVGLAAQISMGDNVRGFRIVGVSPAYRNLYRLSLSQGRWPSVMEATLGSSAARQLRLRIGEHFIGEHGLSQGGERHEATPYQVVGVLKPAGAAVDRLVLTDTASAWRVHAAETDPARPSEITALLIHYRSPMAAVILPQLVRGIPDLQAAVPAIEVARLNRLIGAGAEVLRAFGIGLLAVSALGFFLALFSAVQQRQRELALLRVLGARPRRLMAVVTGEGLLMGLASGGLGVALARVGVAILAAALARSGGITLVIPPPGALELSAAAGATILAVAAAIAPSFLAYRIDPAETLRV